jgi:hypothetical protein
MSGQGHLADVVKVENSLHTNAGPRAPSPDTLAPLGGIAGMQHACMHLGPISMAESIFTGAQMAMFKLVCFGLLTQWFFLLLLVPLFTYCVYASGKAILRKLVMHAMRVAQRELITSTAAGSSFSVSPPPSTFLSGVESHRGKKLE